MDNFLYFCVKNLYYDLSLEPSHWDGSNEGHDLRFC